MEVPRVENSLYCVCWSGRGFQSGECQAGRERNKGRGSPRARDEGFFTNWDIAGKGLLGTLYGTFSEFSYYINLTQESCKKDSPKPSKSAVIVMSCFIWI